MFALIFNPVPVETHKVAMCTASELAFTNGLILTFTDSLNPGPTNILSGVSITKSTWSSSGSSNQTE